MLLFEAEHMIKSRQFPADYADFGEIIKQGDADIMALRCIAAQIRLADMLNEWWDDLKEEDFLSAQTVYEILSQIRFDYEPKEGEA